MKTRLLRKIRKRFEINYFPHEEHYLIIDKKEDDFSNYFWICDVSRNHLSKQSAINAILKIVKFQFRKYSRINKLKAINYKVWHNETN